MVQKYTFFFLLIFVISCNSSKKKADLLIRNAVIYTADKNLSSASAMVIDSGKIVAVGNADSLEKVYSTRQSLDAWGRAIYPGFIDAHAHFFHFGLELGQINLVGSQSWNEIIDSLKNYGQKNPNGWILGAGWDQNHWKVKEFPNRAKLDSLFPDRPVALGRVDGHALIVNGAALKLAGIQPGQKVEGGSIEVMNGKCTGILIDNAKELILNKVPKPDSLQQKEAFLRAQAKCFAVGLTTVSDCGVPYTLIKSIQKLQASGELKMRLFLMLSDDPENYAFIFNNGIIKTPALQVGAIKVYADGALGSRGACLLNDYSDKPGWKGFLLSSPEHFKKIAQMVYDKGLQLCTHAIGDSANRLILKTYAEVLKTKNDRRWRIEHAQIISPEDLKYFGDYSIIPSVQPTHATSDMNWAKDRLGYPRILAAYTYRSLLKQNGWMALGTDFPVENINPLYTFYASVIRKDLKGYPKNGFQTEEALSRKEALLGMTLWAAKAGFEEKDRGSLEPGKWADFVIMDQDIMKIEGSEIPKVQVWSTFLGGKPVFQSTNSATITKN